MPTRETAPVGAPCWVDLMTSDTERARELYCQLFGWTAEEPSEEFGGYFNFTKDGVRVAGCMASQPGAQVPDLWSVYLATDDARKTADAAVAHAGQVIVSAMDVGDLGTMAVLSDPGGAGIGVWQPGLHRGFGVLGEPGTPSWFELHTRDYQATVAFFRDVFGWEFVGYPESPVPYLVANGEGEEGIGISAAITARQPDIVKAPVPTIAVEHIDQAMLDIAMKGGQQGRVQDIPGYGRFGYAIDSEGNIIALLQRT